MAIRPFAGRLKRVPYFMAGVVLVACTGEVVQSTIDASQLSAADVVDVVIAAFNSGDESSLADLASEDLAFPAAPSPSESPSVAELVASAHSVAVEADSEWAMADLAEDDETAVASIGVIDVDPSMLELALDRTADGWKLTAIRSISVEIPPGLLSLRVVDSGHLLSLEPELIGSTELYIEISNNAPKARQCEILDVADIESDEALDGLLGLPEERASRLQAGLPTIQSGETTVAHFVDGIEPGSYLMLCYDAADPFLDVYGHRFNVSADK